MKVFFFNPSTKTSVWERPAELKGRSDVDKLVKCPPDVANPQPVAQDKGRDNQQEGNSNNRNDDSDSSEGSDEDDSSSKGKKRPAFEKNYTPVKKQRFVKRTS